MAIFVGAMGFLFSNLWRLDVDDYLPFLATGFIAWLPVSAIIAESGAAFIAAEGLLRQMHKPYTLFICVVICRNMVLFAHHLSVYVVLVVLFGVPVNWNTLLVLPGLIFVCANGLWVGLLVGAVCARYRDVQPLIASILQLLLFVTPIFWPPELLAKRGVLLVDVNLFYHFVSVVRAPLLGQAPAALSWYAVAGTTVIGWAATLLMFQRIRPRLAYWL
jgi:ABC-type polysaccharide/polyol phosphate export permease